MVEMRRFLLQPPRQLLSLHLPCSLVQANPEMAMDCIMQMAQHITRAQKAQVAHLLSTVGNDDPS